MSDATKTPGRSGLQAATDAPRNPAPPGAIPPRITRAVHHGVIKVSQNTYHASHLASDGDFVQVGYDLEDPGCIWVYDTLGRYLGSAMLMGTGQKIFSADRIEAARDARAKGRLERFHRMTEAQAEAKATPCALTLGVVEDLLDYFCRLFRPVVPLTDETEGEDIDALTRAWLHALSPLTAQDALAAARLWCSIGHRFPTPADLLGCVNTIRAVQAIWPGVHFPPLVAP